MLVIMLGYALEGEGFLATGLVVDAIG